MSSTDRLDQLLREGQGNRDTINQLRPRLVGRMTSAMTPMPLEVWLCQHCTQVRKTPCAKVCRLDPDHEDTAHWDMEGQG